MLLIWCTVKYFDILQALTSLCFGRFHRKMHHMLSWSLMWNFSVFWCAFARASLPAAFVRVPPCELMSHSQLPERGGQLQVRSPLSILTSGWQSGWPYWHHLVQTPHFTAKLMACPRSPSWLVLMPVPAITYFNFLCCLSLHRIQHMLSVLKKRHANHIIKA